MTDPKHSSRDKYFERLGFPQTIVTRGRLAALSRAHDLRKFEIENYWRRSTYFWGFQLVAFAALALSKNEEKYHSLTVLVIAVVGALAAFTSILSARGSKFWQSNWESHVDFLEDEIEGKLHKTALVGKSGISYSVSRVNERFLELLFAGWLVVFGITAGLLLFPALSALSPACAATLQVLFLSSALVLGMIWLKQGQKSSIRDRAFDAKTMDPWDEDQDASSRHLDEL